LFLIFLGPKIKIKIKKEQKNKDNVGVWD
jgi:hypothetical protein